MAKRILRLPGTEQKVGLKKSCIYELIEHELFPQPVRLGSRAHGWLEDELDRWIDQQAEKRPRKGWKVGEEAVA